MRTLLEAWRRIKSKLLTVGDGPDATILRRHASPNVEFYGPTVPEFVPDLIDSVAGSPRAFSVARGCMAGSS